MGKMITLAMLMVTMRRLRPKIIASDLPTLSVLFIRGAIPSTVINSARAFMDVSTMFPLRKRMARKAIAEVVAPEGRLNIKVDNTIGIPVKSNLSAGNNGNGILSPENFSV